MNRAWHVVALLAVLLGACGGGAGTSTVTGYAAAGQALDRFVGSKVSGYAFIVIAPDGSTLYEHSDGSINMHTALPIASACKVPAVAAIMTLVDQGKLDLDAPVAQYLDFTWPDASQVTLRMLLDHTSGLPGLGPNDVSQYPACLGDQSGDVSLRDCAQQITQIPLESAPGSHFNYGGADYQIAGYIATLVSGKSWDTLFHDAISGPLGMTSFTFAPPPKGDGGNPRIAGGASANAADYVHFVQMMLNDGVYDGTRILSTASVAAMEKDEIAGLPVTYTPAGADAASYPGYGLGLFISAPALHPGSPGPEYSDQGFFGATPWFDLGAGYGAVLLINPIAITGGETADAVGRDMWNAVRPIIIDQLSQN